MHSVCWKVGGAFKVSLELSHAHFFCVFVTAWPNAVLINMVPPWLRCTSTVFEELWGGTFVPLYCAHLSSSAKKSCQTLILLSALYCVRMCLHMQNVWFNMMEGLQTKCLDLHVFLSPSLFFSCSLHDCSWKLSAICVPCQRLSCHERTYLVKWLGSRLTNMLYSMVVVVNLPK